MVNETSSAAQDIKKLMKYEMRNNVSGNRQNQRFVTSPFMEPLLAGQEPWVYLGFGIVMIGVVLACALGPSPLVAVALIVGVAFAVIAVARPILAILLVFTGAAVPRLLVPLSSHPIRPVELGIYLCLLVIVCRRSTARLRLPQLLGALFLGIAIVSFMHVPEVSGVHYSAYKGLYLVTILFLAFVVGTFLARYITKPASFLVLTLLGNIPLHFVVLEQLLHINLIPALAQANSLNLGVTDGRLWGPTPGAVIFGSYVINVFAISLACWLLGASRRDRLIGFVMTVIVALEIVGSGTRGSAIAAVLVLLAGFVLTRRFKTLLATVLLGIAGVSIFLSRIMSLFNHDQSSAANRFFLSNIAIKLMEANPWIGIGLQQFHYYYAHVIVAQSSRLNTYDTVVHQQYLEWGAEGGIAWMVVGSLMLLSIIFCCFQAYRFAPQKYRIILLAAILAVLANIVAAFGDVPLDQMEGAVVCFMLSGLALGCAESYRQRPAKSFLGSFPFLTQSSGQARMVAYAVAAGEVEGQKPASTVVAESVAVSAQLQDLDTIGMPSVKKGNEQNLGVARVPGVKKAEQLDTDTAGVPSVKKTSRTVIIKLISWGIAIPVIFPMTALLTRYLGPIQYGEYSYTFPFFAIFALLSGTGMDPFIIRNLSRQKRVEWTATLNHALGTRAFTCLLSALASIGVAWLMPISAEQRTLLLLGSVSLFFSFSFNGLRAVYSYGFVVEQRAGPLFILETVNRVLTAGLVLLVVVLHLSIIWAYCLLVYSDIPFFIIQVIIARRRYKMRVRFSWAYARKQFIGSLSLTGYDALALVNGQADLLFLSLLAGPLNVGLYALAMKITDPLQSIVFAYMGGLYPLLCKKFEEGRAQFGQVFHEGYRILGLVAIPLAIYVSAEAHAIVELLGGAQFTQAAIAVQLLMWATVIGFFHLLTIRACTAANLDRWTPYITLVATCFNIIANIVCIPRWQIAGAGIAAVISEVVGLCLYSCLLARHVYLFKTLGVMSLILLANVPMLLFLLWQERASLLVTTPIALLLCGLGCLVTRTLKIGDIVMLWQLVLARRNKSQVKDRLSEIIDQPTVMMPRIQVAGSRPSMDITAEYEMADSPTLVLHRVRV
jgi:O-antigen/teichoic acid export membrane protein